MTGITGSQRVRPERLCLANTSLLHLVQQMRRAFGNGSRRHLLNRCRSCSWCYMKLFIVLWIGMSHSWGIMDESSLQWHWAPMASPGMYSKNGWFKTKSVLLHLLQCVWDEDKRWCKTTMLQVIRTVLECVFLFPFHTRTGTFTFFYSDIIPS